MADAVARAREIDTELGSYCLQVPMVIRVAVVLLKKVMVNIGYRKLRAHAFDPYGLKFQVGQGASSVLSEGLVNAQSYFLSGLQPSFHEVIKHELVR
jgi:hypothetical protein